LTVNIWYFIVAVVARGPTADDEPSLPALLRAGWSAYIAAVRASLDAAGFADLPRSGPYVISAVSRSGAPLAQIIASLAVSKQAAGQLVDALVLRGYLERSVDRKDRRRQRVSLSERGRAAAAIIRGVVDRIDEKLVRLVGAEYVAHTRATLRALKEI